MDAAFTTAAVICAAGSSSRMRGVKKEYQKLNALGGLSVLGACVSAFAQVPSVETIVITVPENGENAAREALPPGFLAAPRPKLLFVTGGKTRRASVFNALCALAPCSPAYVLIHDGARPFVSVSLIIEIIEAVQKHGAVIPLLPLSDTPKECETPLWGGQPEAGDAAVFIKKHLKRANTGIAQTPQAFAFPAILQAHEKAQTANDEEFTDDAEVWGRFCGQVAVIPGSQENRKITFPEDIGGFHA